ncbi:hypothetical protein FA15DRAFT_679087 [Coprinopsis marcescibilis]|uniref:Uncharacterized protein n=1 Tax=Coprinopsis marcescibilis TaxID=230819 RepID=A0A5C3L2N5_COPMA|nr:hypothetical protein FA15DRAFT_679087 [Coprinopsis marcescibilis]
MESQQSSPDIQRFIVQASDVLSDHRITVAPLADPACVIWYTERYLSQTSSGPAEIVENLIHKPTNTICWSVHRPTNIRRQGWYVRMRSPLFPPGVSIPLSPVSTTSPYYVDGALSFKCRTNDVSKLSRRQHPSYRQSQPPPIRTTGSDSNDRNSVASSSSSSSSSQVHSYPPTPTTSPPTSTRHDLPPLRVPSSIAKQGRSLTGGNDADGNVDDTGNIRTPLTGAFEEDVTEIRTPTSASMKGHAEGFVEVGLAGSKSNGKRKQQNLGTEPSSEEIRGPPPLVSLSHISEFILVPLSETYNATSGSFVNLALPPSDPMPSPRPYPHSHHRTNSNSYSSHSHSYSTPPVISPNMGNGGGGGMLSKAFNLLKSSIPTTLGTSLASSMQGNSFTITRVPDVPKSNPNAPPPLGGPSLSVGDVKRGGAASPPPAYTSTANLLGVSSSNGSGSNISFRPSSYHAPTSISSMSFTLPLPPPLLSFADETSMFPVSLASFNFFGISSLIGGGGSSAPSSSAGTMSNSLPTTAPPPAPSSSSLSPSQSHHPHSASISAYARPPPSPTPKDYSTLGTITVSRRQLEELGVDPAFWIMCALVFWGYLEEREGYLSAIDD